MTSRQPVARSADSRISPCGPSLADRTIALNGLVLVGRGAIATHAAHTAAGAFLPTLVAIALVGPIGNGMIARFIEARKR